MIALPVLTVRQILVVGCTVRVSNTSDDLSAQVELEPPVQIGPGDRVLVHGGPIQLADGQERTERRLATVIRASLLRRLLARIASYFDCLSLLDVEFNYRSHP